jgi:hypothetical protein
MTRKIIMVRNVAVIFLAWCLCGCMATTGNYRPLNGGATARAADCQVSVYKDAPPKLPYVAISRLNVHLEKTFFVSSDYVSAAAELKRQACLSGAEAVVDLQEQSSSYLETRIYNLSGTGARFLAQDASR